MAETDSWTVVTYVLRFNRTATKTGFDKWVGRKMKRATFAKAHIAARKRLDAVDALVRALDAVREDSGMSKAELARAIDAKPEIIRRLFTTAGANPTLKTVVEIAAALGLELRLVRTAGKKTTPRAKSTRAVA